jgi:hypothetical protein
VTENLSHLTVKDFCAESNPSETGIMRKIRIPERRARRIMQRSELKD